MRIVIISIFTFLSFLAGNRLLAQEYDSLKAVAYGADAYGMKQYVMAFLKAGPNTELSKEERSALMQAHLANILRMESEGTLVMAGPFLDNGPLRGIYIFNVATLEEAAALTASDPAIQAGTLEMELHPWYGSAALLDLTKSTTHLRGSPLWKNNRLFIQQRVICTPEFYPVCLKIIGRLQPGPV
jgi:uncharacterized protein YciI